MDLKSGYDFYLFFLLKLSNDSDDNKNNKNKMIINGGIKLAYVICLFS